MRFATFGKVCAKENPCRARLRLSNLMSYRVPPGLAGENWRFVIVDDADQKAKLRCFTMTRRLRYYF